MHTVSSQHASNGRVKSFLTLCLIIIAITVYRGWILFHIPELSLHFDEAQYWLWAQDLQWGYYSKPPFLAATIKVFTDLFGNSAPAIRSVGLCFYPLTALTLYFLALKITDRPHIALWAGIIFITMPGVSLSSLLITTDVVLFLWWSLSCYFFYCALQTNRNSYWLLLGITAGFGLLTKYTMGIFAMAAFAFLVTIPRWRPQLKNPKLWLSALLSACIFLPNLLWNDQNGWPSIRHTAELSGEGVTGIHPLSLITFWGEQFGVFGIISFAIFIYWLAKQLWQPKQMNETQAFLLYFSAAFLVIISMQALKGRAYANWAAPAYAIASIIVAIEIVNKRTLKILLIITNVLLMGLVYHGDSLQTRVKPEATQGPDPLKTLRAWDSWAQQIEDALKTCANCSIIVDSRESAAQLTYKLRKQQPRLLFWNPNKNQDSHYEMVYSLPSKPRQGEFLFITEKTLNHKEQDSFERVTKVSEFDRQGKYTPIRHYFIYRVENFKGYQP